MVDVFLNGKLIGKYDDASKLVEKLKNLRRSGKTPFDMTISQDEFSIRVFTDSGRVVRPLIVVKDGKSQLGVKDLEELAEGKTSWKKLVEQGKVEFLDTAEEENTLIAISPDEVTNDHTHLEIHPLALLGVPASLVPYANNSRGDRVNYGASKGIKQALGIYAVNYPLRFDTFSNIAHYPQTPIVRTSTTSIVGYDAHPGGQNMVVAMMCWEGFNMEDAIVINRGAIDRSLGRSTYYRPYSAAERRYPGGQEDKIEIPSKDIGGYRAETSYRLLGEDGVGELEQFAGGEDVIIGRSSPPRFVGAVNIFRRGVEERRETSVVVKHGEQGFVDMVVLTEDGNGHKLVRVRVRDDRIPELGDKISSRHGQKGVIGLVVPEENMPHTADGTVPDLITNPHGIPSRMTVSQVLEFLAGKSGAISARFINGDPFSPEPVEGMRQMLKAYGFRPDGNETLYDGITGDPYQTEIFMGIAYYHKLRHMVTNKIHARSRGPVQVLTHQPTEGRSKKGGLRMGEMEKDCLVAHGASLLLKERFDSDKTIIPICEKCGVVAIFDRVKNRTICPLCKESNVHFIEESYAFYVLVNEMMGLGVYPQIILEDKS